MPTFADFVREGATVDVLLRGSLLVVSRDAPDGSVEHATPGPIVTDIGRSLEVLPPDAPPALLATILAGAIVTALSSHLGVYARVWPGWSDNGDLRCISVAVETVPP